MIYIDIVAMYGQIISMYHVYVGARASGRKKLATVA
jgi:hypothetical protein